jgi:hypothetical protein
MIAPTMADVEREMRELMSDEAREAVFCPTPLDLLGLAQLRHDFPEFALKLATEVGKEFDREHR